MVAGHMYYGWKPQPLWFEIESAHHQLPEMGLNSRKGHWFISFIAYVQLFTDAMLCFDIEFPFVQIFVLIWCITTQCNEPNVHRMSTIWKPPAWCSRMLPQSIMRPGEWKPLRCSTAFLTLPFSVLVIATHNTRRLMNTTFRSVNQAQLSAYRWRTISQGLDIPLRR